MYTAVSKPAHGSMEWLSLRWRDADGRCRFGASEAPTLMGDSPYQTRGDLYAAKRVPPVIGEQTEAFRRGHLLEPVLLAEAGRLLGTEIIQPEEMFVDGRWIVTLDGADAPEPTIVVEAKTTTRYSIRSAEDLPAEWLWQTCVQGSVLGAERVYVVCLDRDQRISLTEVPVSQAAWEMLCEEAEMLGAAIDEERPLPPSEFTAEQIAEIWQPQARSIELPSDARRWILALDEARVTKRNAEKQEKEARDELARLLLDAEAGTIDGQPVITWKQQQGAVRLDTQRLREEQPDLVTQYESRGAAFRVMRLVGNIERLG
jgi:predicted phage-related endonuclease